MQEFMFIDNEDNELFVTCQWSKGYDHFCEEYVKLQKEYREASDKREDDFYDVLNDRLEQYWVYVDRDLPTVTYRDLDWWED